MHSTFGIHTMRPLQDIKALLSLIGIMKILVLQHISFIQIIGFSYFIEKYALL